MYVDHTPEIVGDRLEAEASFWAEEAEKKNTTEDTTVAKNEDAKEKTCEQCGSNNTHISPNEYDTVMVCNNCHAEEHKPYATPEDKEPSDEEKYEMRAAFGEGVTVVNFFTGKTVYRT
jgi:hypothetical protein